MNEGPEQNEAMPTLEMTTEAPSESKASDNKNDDAVQKALAAPCEVRLRHQSGRHILSIPELGLMVSGKNLDTAHAELMAQREKRIREFAAEGLLHWLDRPAESCAAAAQPSTLQKLKPFLIKCLVVSMLFLSAVNLIGGRLGDVGYVLEKKLQGLSNWTPEQVEWHRARSEQIAQKLGPTMRELLAMFHDQPAGTEKAAAASVADNATATNTGATPTAVATPAAAVAPAPEAAPATTPEPAKPTPAKPAQVKQTPAKQAPKHTAKP